MEEEKRGSSALNARSYASAHSTTSLYDGFAMLGIYTAYPVYLMFAMEDDLTQLDERARYIADYYGLEFRVDEFGYVVQQTRERPATQEELALWQLLGQHVPECGMPLDVDLV